MIIKHNILGKKTQIYETQTDTENYQIQELKKAHIE